MLQYCSKTNLSLCPTSSQINETHTMVILFDLDNYWGITPCWLPRPGNVPQILAVSFGHVLLVHFTLWWLPLLSLFFLLLLLVSFSLLSLLLSLSLHSQLDKSKPSYPDPLRKKVCTTKACKCEKSLEGSEFSITIHSNRPNLNIFLNK